MKVKDLKEALANVPEDFDVDITKFLAIDYAKEKVAAEGEEDGPDTYQIRLDYPMLGIATDTNSKELIFVVGGKGKEELAWLLEFSKDIKKL